MRMRRDWKRPKIAAGIASGHHSHFALWCKTVLQLPCSSLTLRCIALQWAWLLLLRTPALDKIATSLHPIHATGLPSKSHPCHWRSHQCQQQSHPCQCNPIHANVIPSMSMAIPSIPMVIPSMPLICHSCHWQSHPSFIHPSWSPIQASRSISTIQSDDISTGTQYHRLITKISTSLSLGQSLPIMCQSHLLQVSLKLHDKLFQFQLFMISM